MSMIGMFFKQGMGLLGNDIAEVPDHEAMCEDALNKHNQAMEMIKKLQMELVNVTNETHSTMVHEGPNGEMLMVCPHTNHGVWSECVSTDSEHNACPHSGVCITPQAELCVGGCHSNGGGCHDNGHGRVPPQ